MLAVLPLYAVLEALSFLHEHDGLPVTPWNPALGVMFALIIAGGGRYGVLLFAGVLLSEYLVLRSSLPVHVIVSVGIIVAGSYTAIAMALRDRLHLGDSDVAVVDILRLAAGGLAGALISSSLLSGLLLSVAHFDLSDIARTAMPLVLGDVIGIVVVTPLLLRLSRMGHVTVTTGRLLELVAFSAGVFLLLAAILARSSTQQSLFYMLFLPIVIAAVRHGIDGACAGLAVTQFILVALLQYHGFELSRFTEYQFLMLVLTLTGLVVGALVSERRRADETAREAGRRLQEAHVDAAHTARLHLVSGMAAALAHEINQPMTAARALARSAHELLKRPEQDLERIGVNLAKTVEQIDHAGAVVQRMREFLRKGQPRISSLDIVDVLAQAVALVDPLMQNRRISLVLKTGASLPTVLGDRVQVQQVVVNLARNAADAIQEAGRSDGRIEITARTISDAEVEISLADNGAGIAPELRTVLFEPLQTTRDDGLGLGLAICRTIVEGMGGRIRLDSSAPGHTVFRFTLPRAGGEPPSRSATP